MTTATEPAGGQPQTDDSISPSVPTAPVAPASVPTAPVAPASVPTAPVAPPTPVATVTPEGDAGARDEPRALEPIGQYARDFNLLLSDARTAFILVNHVRHRALERLFGISPDQANAVTVIGLMLLAQSAHDKVGRLLKTHPAPTPSDGLFVGAAVGELLGNIAGSTVRDSPGVSSLVALALVGTAARPAAVKSLRVLRSSSHRLSMGFHHRYGYLVDPGHWRQRRAQRATSEAVDSAAPLGSQD